ncbi:MAG: hypothetical protein J6A36_03485 [Clostridia bacterium]|nr:hypothetical protein [Clostridia bacterium]
MSDDEYVEVTSGLNEGDTIQVVTTTKQNTIRSSSNDKYEKNGMSGMNRESGFERPNMPDGASMPSGSSGFQAPTK